MLLRIGVNRKAKVKFAYNAIYLVSLDALLALHKW